MEKGVGLRVGPLLALMLATTDDFELRHGPLAEDEEKQVEALLTDASALIETELGELPEGWGKSDPGIPAIVTAICVQVVYRAWSNPDGIASEMLGEASRTYRGNNPADALWLTENEKRLIRKAAAKPRVTSIPVETPYSGDPDELSPLDFSFPLEDE